MSDLGVFEAKVRLSQRLLDKHEAKVVELRASRDDAAKAAKAAGATLPQIAEWTGRPAATIRSIVYSDSQARPGSPRRRNT